MSNPNTKVVKMRVGDLEVHPAAQRPKSDYNLNKLRKNWNMNKLGVLHVVQRVVNGKVHTYIVDGQHRHHILMEKGYGDWLIDVQIHLDVTTDAEACERFLGLNDLHLVACLAKFNKEVIARLSPAAEIQAIVDARLLEITHRRGDGRLRCVVQLKHAYELDGGVSLAAALDTILAAWGNVTAGLDGHIVYGIAQVFNQHGGRFKQPDLVKTLAKYPGGATALLGAGRGHRGYTPGVTLAEAVADVVLALYNVKRTSRRIITAPVAERRSRAKAQG